MLNKIRFQNPYFRRKLKEARGYKRPAKKIPETKLGIFLAKIGLGSLALKLALAGVLFFLGYLLFLPNFLTIKNVTITGLGPQAKESALVTVNAHLNSRVLWPQKNLFLLSTEDLSAYISKNNFGISKVIQIEKDYPASLNLKLAERYEKFLLRTPSSLYVVSNDGIIIRQLSLTDTALALANNSQSGLIGISLSQENIYYERQAAAEPKYFENLNELLSLAQTHSQASIVRISLESFDRPDILGETPLGYEIKFDINSDLPKIFSQLRLLLKEVGEGRMSGVKYIDLRVKDKGYVCYKDAPCANASSIIINPATSTPSRD